MDYHITVQINGSDVHAGTLYANVRNGKESASFRYDDGYLARTDEDIKELWVRILFSCAVGNTDDHMRNHGFLRVGGAWHLSPAFDINPSPGDNEKHLCCAIDFDNDRATPQAAIDACEWYRLARERAKATALQMALVLKGWRKVAASNGISKASCDYMASCMDASVERLQQVV